MTHKCLRAKYFNYKYLIRCLKFSITNVNFKLFFYLFRWQMSSKGNLFLQILNFIHQANKKLFQKVSWIVNGLEIHCLQFSVSCTTWNCTRRCHNPVQGSDHCLHWDEQPLLEIHHCNWFMGAIPSYEVHSLANARFRNLFLK